MMTKILLVDDENLLLHSLTTTLRHDGADVTAVSSGKDALREIYRFPYDICFLDVQLPDANGLDLMKVVRKVSPETAVIIMTAVELNDGQLKHLNANAGHYLPKPFDLDQVRLLVRRIREKGDVAALEA